MYMKMCFMVFESKRNSFNVCLVIVYDMIRFEIIFCVILLFNNIFGYFCYKVSKID